VTDKIAAYTIDLLKIRIDAFCFLKLKARKLEFIGVMKGSYLLMNAKRIHHLSAELLEILPCGRKRGTHAFCAN